MNLSSFRLTKIHRDLKNHSMSDLVLLLSILPAIIVAILVYVYVDIYEKEPTGQVVLTYFLGLGLSLIAYFIEEFIHTHHADYGSNLMLTLGYSFYAVSLPEETIKLFGIWLIPYRSRQFNEPLDGIIYAVMLGMGFATLENILYGFMYGLETILVRSLTAVPAHGVFAILLGYFVGKYKFGFIDLRGLLKGYLLVLLFHSAYDFFIIQHISDMLLLGALVVLSIGIVVSVRFAKELQNSSPFKI